MAEKLPVSLEIEPALNWLQSLGFFKSKKTLPPDSTVKVLRRMAGAPSTKVRGAALRACRNIAATSAPKGVELLNKNRVHLMAVKSLEREAKYLEERIQALKLLRAMAQYCPDKVPRTLVRSLVAISCHRDDQLKEAALECVREYALLNTRVVAECGGITAMVTAILEPTMTHMADSLLLTLLHLLNQEETRVWLRPSLDLAVLLAPFTASDGVVEGEEERKVKRKLARRAIVMMMRTWTGLSILASDPQGLRSLVQMLVQPVSYDLRKDVLDTILEIFNTVNPLRASSLGSAHAHANSADGKRNGGDGGGEGDSLDGDFDQFGVNSYGAEPYMAEYWGVGPGAAGSKELAAGGFHAERVPGRHAHMHTLLDNFFVMVLLAFVQYGLVEALVELSVSSAPPMSRTATQLLSFVSRFSTRLLPNNVSRRLLSQKKLVASAVDAARAGEVADRARSQRAAHVIGILSRIVGSGYDTALATLLSRSTYEDGLALASELALMGSYERAHLNLGVFPRPMRMASLPMELLLQAKAPMVISETNNTLTANTPSAPLPHRSNSSGGKGSSFVSTFKRMSRRMTVSSSKNDSTAPQTEMGSRNDMIVEDQANLAAPLVANRGHRKFVQQLMMTDMAQTTKKTGGGLTITSASAVPEEVAKLLTKARIMIKTERREWTRWDWVAIDELVSGPCQDPQICLDILKSKFFRRLSAFFAVSSNGPFAQLAWEPDFVAYTNVAVSMVRLLLNIKKTEAMDFLTEDRRGRLAAQISEALLKELSHAEGADQLDGPGGVYGGGDGDHGRNGATSGVAKKPTVGANAADDDEDEDDFDQIGGAVGNRVFTAQACATTMIRDFFVVLGVFASSNEGAKILEQLGVFSTLSRLSLHREKDYILRLAISHLDYSAPSAPSDKSVDTNPNRTWLQTVLLNTKISIELRHFAIGFFRSMIRSVQNQRDYIAQWILSLCFSQLRFPDVASDALSVLIEATHYPVYLDVMVEMMEETVQGEKNEFTVNMNVLQKAPARKLLLKLLGSDVGVRALKTLGWLETIVKEWNKTEYLGYLEKVDATLLYQLVDQRKASSAWARQVHMPKPIPVRAHEASALSEPGFAASELQWLFRMPFRVEVWAESSVPTFRINMDAFVDCSRLRPESVFSPKDSDRPAQGEANVPRGICVSAVPPWSRDKDQIDRRQRSVIPEDATIYIALTVANQPIDRRGRVFPVPSAGGGFAYAFGGTRHEYSDSGPTTMASGALGRDKFRSFATSRKAATTRGGFSTVGRPSGQSDAELRVDDEFDGEDFAEAPGASTDQDRSVRPLSDERFFIKCTPQMRKAAMKEAAGNSSRPVMAFSLCPPNSGVTLHFTTLDAQHRESVARDSSRDLEKDSPAEIPKPTEPEVRVVNPLLALKRDKAGSSTMPQTGAGVDQSERPPILILREVRFHLELVPHRFATPSIPVHLAGELAKSDSGMNEIRDLRLIERFLETLVNSKGTASSADRRAALWALGHIGATDIGFGRIESIEPGFVREVHRVALEDPCVSLRGAAVYTLGFFSRHPFGCKALNDLGWATLDSRSHPFATIAVPANPRHSPFLMSTRIDTVLNLSRSVHTPVDGVLAQDEIVVPIKVSGAEAQKILACISDLSNHIAQKEAHGELMKLMEALPAAFTNIKLYLAVHDLLARFSFELPVRQFVLNIFHAKINFESEQTWSQLDAEQFH